MIFKYNKPSVEVFLKEILHESKFKRDKTQNKLTDLDYHFQKHRNEFENDGRFINVKNDYKKFRKMYDNAADNLSKQSASPVSQFDNPDVRYVGFVTKDGRTVKFDKVTSDLVVYRGPVTISFYNLKGGSKNYNKNKVKRIFKNKVKSNYKKDIPNTDKYQKC